MTCIIDGCTGTVKARNWCTTHYGRWQRHGDPHTVVQPKAAITTDELATELVWLLDAGESVWQAARAFDMRPDTIYTRLRRTPDAPDRDRLMAAFRPILSDARAAA